MRNFSVEAPLAIDCHRVTLTQGKIFFFSLDSSKNDNKKIPANMSYNLILDVVKSEKM